MRAAIGTTAAIVTWLLMLRVLAAGWLAQHRADRLDARTRHADAMAGLRRVTHRD